MAGPGDRDDRHHRCQVLGAVPRIEAGNGVGSEYDGDVEGVYDNWRHVSSGFNGTQYSSPYTNKTTHDTIPSISEVERIYKCKYIGWSEDIAGLKVIGGQMVTQELFNIMWAAFVRTPPTDADIAYAIGKPLDQYIVDLSKNPYATVQRTDVDAIWKKLTTS